MSKRMLMSGFLMTAILGVSDTFAQTPPAKPVETAPAINPMPKSGAVWDNLPAAMRSNPDIRVAEAKVRVAEAGLSEAQAELNRVRMTVLVQVTIHRSKIELQRSRVTVAQEQLKRMISLKDAGSLAERQMADVTLAEAKAMLAQLEAELDVLTGAKSPQIGSMMMNPSETASDNLLKRIIAIESIPAAPVVRDATTRAVSLTPSQEAMIAILSSDFSINDAMEVTLPDLFAVIRENSADKLSFRVSPSVLDRKIALTKGTFPISAWIQMIEDEDKGLRFVVRDYGILVTDVTRVPDGAMTVEELMQMKAKPKSKPGDPRLVSPVKPSEPTPDPKPVPKP